jgi:hypothetical protein
MTEMANASPLPTALVACEDEGFVVCLLSIGVSHRRHTPVMAMASSASEAPR